MKEGTSYLILLTSGDVIEVNCLKVSVKGYKIQNQIDESGSDLVNNFPYWILQTDVSNLGDTPSKKYQIVEEL